MNTPHARPLPQPLAKASRLRVVAVLALLCLLPGCLTRELWRGAGRVHTTRSLSFVGERERELVGTVRPSPPTRRHGLWWDGDGGAFYLVARHGPGAEVAATLLDGVDFATVRRASIAAVRESIDAELDRDDANVTLELTVDRAAVAEVVPASQLPRLLRPELESTAATANGPDAAVLDLPPSFREASRRLQRLDLRWLAASEEPTTLGAWAFVGRDGRTPLSADDVRQAHGLESDAPWPDVHACLQRASLFVRLDHGHERTFVRLRLDRVWMLAECDASERGFVHTSAWNLQRLPPQKALPPADNAPRIPARLWLFEREWQRSFHRNWPVLDVLARTALTPITLAADLALGPGALDLFRALTGQKQAPLERTRPLPVRR